MPPAHARRRQRLAETLRAQDVDAALITRLVNVRYLTGFTGSTAALLVTNDAAATLATDGRYTLQVAAECPDVAFHETRSTALDLARRVTGRLGFEEHHVTVELHGRLQEAAPGTLTPLQHAVERMRVVKDDDELAAIGRACAVAERAFADLLSTIRPGRTEREIAADLENRMREHGADAAAFDTIVATGPNSAAPHHRPGGRRAERGDLVKIDFGALVDGYRSDITRTYVIGEPQPWQRDLHALVAEAQRAGRDAVRAGVDTETVFAAARAPIVAAGHGDHFPHGLGHGIGLEIHEAPLVGHAPPTTLEAGSPITVEPGVYVPGRGGVRIEDTLVVRTDGPELLTHTTRDLLAL